MGRLSLHLLGTPEVTHDGTTVVFKTRKTLALLVYLVIERKQTARATLVDLLWPGRDPVRGRAAFRRALAYLQAALGAAGSDPADYLIVKRDSLGFNLSSNYDLDLRLFRSAAAQSRTAVRPAWEDPAGHQRQLAQFQTALLHTRGALLEGLSFDDAPAFVNWLDKQRSDWRKELRGLCDRLITWQTEGGESADAIATATRWTTLDPLHEAAYQRAITLFCATGNRASAVATYATWYCIVTRELAIVPAPETLALVKHIRQTKVLDSPGETTDACAFRLTAEPFVGRDREQGQLMRAFRLARQGQVVAMVISGATGLGKTRLATTFATWAKRQGALVLAGQGKACDAATPFAPIIRALHDYVTQETAPKSLVPAAQQQQLDHFLADIAGRQQQVDIEALLAIFTDLITAQTEHAALVLVLDDLDRADADTRDFLTAALKRWAAAQRPVLLIATQTITSAATPPSMETWLRHLATSVPVTRLALQPLSAEEVTQRIRLLGQIAVLADGVEVEGAALAALSRWLFDQTGGQPTALQTVLQLLMEHRILEATMAGGGWVVFDADRITPALLQLVAAVANRQRD